MIDSVARVPLAIELPLLARLHQQHLNEIGIAHSRERHIQLSVTEHSARQKQPDIGERLTLRLIDGHSICEADGKLPALQLKRIAPAARHTRDARDVEHFALARTSQDNGADGKATNTLHLQPRAIALKFIEYSMMFVEFLQNIFCNRNLQRNSFTSLVQCTF